MQPTLRIRHAEDETVVDVVLSSGFLSFANHAGFLKAVEEVRTPFTYLWPCIRTLQLVTMVPAFQFPAPLESGRFKVTLPNAIHVLCCAEWL